MKRRKKQWAEESTSLDHRLQNVDNKMSLTKWVMNTSRTTKSDLLTVLADIDDDRRSIVDLTVAYVFTPDSQ